MDCDIIVALGDVNMDSNITFRIDTDIKQQMSAICKELGMTTSTAFNLFANAFVRAKGMPFPVTTQINPVAHSISPERMAADAGAILDEFSADYARMAE